MSSDQAQDLAKRRWSKPVRVEKKSLSTSELKVMAITILLLRVNLLRPDINAEQLSLSLLLDTGHVKNYGLVKADLQSQVLKTEEENTDGRYTKVN